MERGQHLRELLETMASACSPVPDAHATISAPLVETRELELEKRERGTVAPGLL